MNILVSGLSQAENIGQVVGLPVQVIGFDFRESSPRFVSLIHSGAGFLPDYAQAAHRAPADSQRPIGTLGCFCDDMPQTIVTRVVNHRLDYVQLDGEELPVMIDNLKRTLVSDIQPGIRVVKSFVLRNAADFALCDAYHGCADLLRFDLSALQSPGRFDLLRQYSGPTPFIVAGSIAPEDAAQLRGFTHPQCWGVELNEGFEDEPGLKNLERLRLFIENLGN